jgi:hypothetical protein
MKNKRALEIDRRANIRASSEKSNFTRHLVGFWRDLEDNQRWKYDELSPLQLLEKLKPDECPANKDELARADFFWRRRPRLLPATGYIAWIIVALGLPAWLFLFSGNRSAASNNIGGGSQRRDRTICAVATSV